MQGMDSYAETLLRHYLIAALWSSTDDKGNPLDEKYSPEDFSEDALEVMKDQCGTFSNVHYNTFLTSEITAEQAGHDFWLTRNGHGAGFWDRGLGHAGDFLTEQCKKWGEVDIYVGDDGKLYVHTAPCGHVKCGKRKS